MDSWVSGGLWPLQSYLWPDHHSGLSTGCHCDCDNCRGSVGLKKGHHTSHPQMHSQQPSLPLKAANVSRGPASPHLPSPIPHPCNAAVRQLLVNCPCSAGGSHWKPLGSGIERKSSVHIDCGPRGFAWGMKGACRMAVFLLWALPILCGVRSAVGQRRRGPMQPVLWEVVQRLTGAQGI